MLLMALMATIYIEALPSVYFSPHQCSNKAMHSGEPACDLGGRRCTWCAVRVVCNVGYGVTTDEYMAAMDGIHLGCDVLSATRPQGSL